MTEIPEEAQKCYMEGLRLFGEQDHAGAIQSYERALELKPDWTDAMHGLAMASMHADQVDRAIEIGKRICELDANDSFAHTSLSMFYQRKSVIAREQGEVEASMGFIEEAEKEGAKARMIAWKEELKTNPDAAPPGPAGSMDVIQ